MSAFLRLASPVVLSPVPARTTLVRDTCGIIGFTFAVTVYVVHYVEHATAEGTVKSAIAEGTVEHTIAKYCN